MNRIFKVLLCFLFLGSTLCVISCDDKEDDKKSESEIQIDKLVGTWSSQSVVHEDVQNPDYGDFQITIAKSSDESMTYTTSGRPSGKLSPWNSSDTFVFGDPIGSELIRGDDVVVSYVFNGANLVLTIEGYSGEGYPGRVNSISGDWVFTMTR